jgi:hypothetical protein
MASDASQVLGSPQLAGVKVNPRGAAWRRSARGSLLAPLGALIVFGRRPTGGPAQTPQFGAQALLAVTRDDLALVTAGKVIARVPRSELSTVDLGRGYVKPLTICFRNGGTWRLEVVCIPRHGKAVRAVAAVLGGPVHQDQRTPRPARAS